MGRPFQPCESSPRQLLTPLMLLFGDQLDDETKQAMFDPMKFEFTWQVECVSSRYGWLLLLSRESSCLFFFNPLTRQKIELPYRKSIFSAVAFSAPPTSPDCTVYVVAMPIFSDKLCVDTFRVNQDKTWIRHVFKPTSLECNTTIQVICCNRVLFCVDLHGRVTIFDAKHSSWSSIPCRKDKSFGGSVCKPYLVEFNGEIYAGKKGSYGVLDEIYKLKFDNDGVTDWVEVEDLD